MDTKERILEVSLNLFNTIGLNQVGVRQIAQALNISPGNLSYHFPRKEDLILTLIHRLSALNDQAYQDFFAGPANLDRYLQTLHLVFNNQYHYRGLLLAGQRDVQSFMTQAGYNYPATESKRLQTLRDIIEKLVEHQQLKAESEDIDFLISFMSLFARFWIQESSLSQRFNQPQDTIRHYLRLLAAQFSLFATDNGKQEIRRFLSSL